MKHSNNKANPLNLSRQSIDTPRNAFDMSHHYEFNSPVGLMLPTLIQDVCPDDYYTLNVANFTRTVPINTAAFTRMTEFTDFYYVPFEQLWKPISQMIEPVQDLKSALALSSQYNNTVGGLPFFTFNDIITLMRAAKYKYSAGFDTHCNSYLARLLDMLGYYSDPETTYVPDRTFGTIVAKNGSDELWIQHLTDSIDLDTHLSPLRILAYNKILNDYYRITDYEPAKPKTFNLDDIEGNTHLDLDRLAMLFHFDLGSEIGVVDYSIFPYTQWAKDSLISYKPSQLYGNFVNPSNVNAGSAGFGIAPPEGGVIGRYSSIPNGFFNTQDIRIAHSLEKLARVSMSAPKTLRAQFNAHYGISSNCDCQSSRYLGNYRSDIKIGEVVATSTFANDSDTNPASNYLGQIAGKGSSVGQRNGVIKAHIDAFGIIMGIHYIKPIAEYQGNRLNPHVTKFSRSDFKIPAFDRLGLQPAYYKSVVLDKRFNDSLMGYQSRYIEYKSRVNEVHGNLQHGRSLAPWTSPRNFNKEGAIGYDVFYVNPHVTDRLFAFGYNGTESTDQFICHYLFDSTLVGNMSVNGTPIL